MFNMLHSGRIPVLVDNNQSAPFPVMETSAELLYLLKFADKDDKFGFTDELERSQCLQWLFFWHGSGAPYQGQTNHFNIYAKEKIPCKVFLSISAMRMSNPFSILHSERSTDPTPLI
jgi:glutathione S-transferase